MNTKQKVSLLIGGLLILVSGIFPTWSIKVSGLEIKTVRKFLYTNSGLILAEVLEDSKTKISPDILSNIHISVDYSRMGVEFAVIILVTLGAVVFLRKKIKDL